VPEIDTNDFDARLNSLECSEAIREIVASLRKAAEQDDPHEWSSVTHSMPRDGRPRDRSPPLPRHAVALLAGCRCRFSGSRMASLLACNQNALQDMTLVRPATAGSALA